jgi:hypothetical protein
MRKVELMKLFLMMLFSLGTVEESVAAETVTYPPAAEAGIICVTNPPSGFAAALPDDGIDDTAAINALLAAYNGQTNGHIHDLASRIFVFPAGTYDISDTLVPMMDGQSASSVTFAGVGVGQTILKLADGAPGFGSTVRPKPVILQGKQYVAGNPRGSGPGACFGNLVRDLSIDLGNNPGAVGVFAGMANMGQVYNLSITAANAFAGLVTYDRASPGLIRNIHIQNCDYGIYHIWDFDDEYYMQFPGTVASDGLTLEHIVIENYKVSGIHNDAKFYIMRDVSVSTTNASGPAIDLGFLHHPSQFVVCDLTIDGDPSQPGIRTTHDDVFVFLRDAEISNCSVSIDLNTGADETDSFFSEYSTHSILSSCRPGPERTLRLPVKETPVYLPGPDEWTKTTMRTNYTGLQNIAALQSDLDNCTTPVLYIPYGYYELESGETLVVSNSCLKMIRGFFPYLVGAPRTEIIDVDGTLFFEDLLLTPNHRIVHDSTNSLVFRNIGVGPIVENTENGTGDIFFENIGAQPRLRVAHGVNVYMRQFNRERKGVVNDGAVIWCLGDNIESMGDPSTMPWITKNGGVSEIIGASFDTMTDASIEEIAIDYVYEIDGADSRFSAVGSGVFKVEVSDGWDLFLADYQGEDFLMNAYDNDFPAWTYPGQVYGRMILPPFIVDRNNLAFYPMNDGETNTTSSLWNNGKVSASSIVQVSKFGFALKSVGINGDCRNVNTMYLEDTDLTLDNYSTNYCQFSITPEPGATMNVSGISFDVAATNENTTAYAVRYHMVDGTAVPQPIGDYAQVSVPAGSSVPWHTHEIDLSGLPHYQGVTNTLIFRMYFTSNVKNWKCRGQFDNVTIHGTCE